MRIFMVGVLTITVGVSAEHVGRESLEGEKDALVQAL